MSTVDDEAEELTPANLPMMFTLTAHEEGRASGRLFLGSPSNEHETGANDALRGNPSGDITNELALLHSRALIMRAVWEAGLNVSVSARGPTRPAVAVVRAELPQTTEEPQRFRLRFQTEANYELWSPRGRLGAGTLGIPFDTEMLRLVVNPLSGRLPEPGADYEVIVSPLEAVLDEARHALRLTIQTDAETEDEARTVELEFRDDVPHRAGTFLRQLVLAYVEERHGWTAPPPQAGGSGLALRPGSMSSGAPYDAYQRDYGRGGSASAPHMPPMDDLEARRPRVSMLHLCLGAIAIGLVAAAITRAGNSSSESEDESAESATLAPSTSSAEPPPAVDVPASDPPALAAPSPALEARAPEAPTLVETAPPQPEAAPPSPVTPAPEAPPPSPVATGAAEFAPPPPPADSPKSVNILAPIQRPVARPKPATALREPAPAPAAAPQPEPSRQEAPVRREPRFTRFQAGPYDLPTNPY